MQETVRSIFLRDLRRTIGCHSVVFNFALLLRVSIPCYAERCISYSKSLRPSVCPSHAGTVSKRLKLRSCGLHWRIVSVSCEFLLRCIVVQSAVLRLHVVRLFVRLCVCLWFWSATTPTRRLCLLYSYMMWINCVPRQRLHYFICWWYIIDCCICHDVGKLVAHLWRRARLHWYGRPNQL